MIFVFNFCHLPDHLTSGWHKSDKDSQFCIFTDTSHVVFDRCACVWPSSNPDDFEVTLRQDKSILSTDLQTPEKYRKKVMPTWCYLICITYLVLPTLCYLLFHCLQYVIYYKVIQTKNLQESNPSHMRKQTPQVTSQCFSQ